MRPLAALVLLAGCASPVIVVQPPESDTGTPIAETAPADTGAALEDTGAPDAAVEDTTPADSGTADTSADGALDTGSPADTGPETCTPLDAGSVCTALAVDVPACGPAPDGCGGKGTIDCGGCPSTRRCAAKSTDPVPHCTCELVSGSCVLYSGLAGRKVRCGPLDAPLAVGSTLIPQPDGKITMYCIPTGA